MAKKPSTLTTKEITYLAIFSTLFSVGIILAFLGFIADFLNVSSQDNWIKNADSAFREFLSLPLTFLQWGSLLMILGGLLLSLVLNTIAQREQVELEKKQRRAQRLQESSIE